MKSLIVLAALLLADAAGAATPGRLLSPSGKWTIAHPDKICALVRTFGEGPDKITVGFKPSPMSETMRVIIIKPDERHRPASGKASIAFGQAEPKDIDFKSRSMKDGTQVATLYARRALLGPLAENSAMAISVKDRLNVAIAVDGFAEAVRQLSQCETDVLKSWGMTEAAITAVHKKPKQKEGTYVQPNDYPQKAGAWNQQGTTGVSISLGTDGLIQDCMVVESSGFPIIDRQTCTVLKNRARFEPALDAQDNPVPTRLYYLISWMADPHSYEEVPSSPPAIVPSPVVSK